MANPTKCDYFSRWQRVASALAINVKSVSTEQCGLPFDWGEVVLLENFGAERGMILLPDGTRVLEYSEAIAASGFGCSVLEPGEISAEQLESLKETLRDWGWTGPDLDRPAWY
jgi:hypothetical protein